MIQREYNSCVFGAWNLYQLKLLSEDSFEHQFLDVMDKNKDYNNLDTYIWCT